MRINAALVTAAILCSATPAAASEMVNFTTVRNTDVASFGIGNLRGAGTGTLNVSGIGGSVSQAYLFWHGPTNSTNASANADVSFGGTSITGSNIGFSADNFWASLNSQAYRADVTGIVSGNGSYSLADFRKADAEINGASLIVFYNDANAANDLDVVLFNGNDSNFQNSFDALNWNATLAGVNYSGGPASLTLHVSDGQNFGATDDGTLTVNGTTLGSGGLYQGNGVQLGSGTAATNGALWDIETFNVTSLLTQGTNTLTLRQGAVTDALSLVVAQFNLPVGSAPPVSAVPEPSTWAMMMSGLGLVAGALRRRRRTASALWLA